MATLEKAAERAKVVWEWREQGWMVHQGRLSEHDWRPRSL